LWLLKLINVAPFFILYQCTGLEIVCTTTDLKEPAEREKEKNLNMVSIHLWLLITLIILAIIGLLAIGLIVSLMVISKRTESQLSNKALAEDIDNEG